MYKLKEDLMTERIWLTKFWKEMVLKHIPDAKISYRKWNRFLKLVYRKENQVCNIGHTIWFHSSFVYWELYQNRQVDAISGHEFVHMVQKKNKKIGWFGYGWPMTSVVVIIPLVILFQIPLEFTIMWLVWAFIPWYAPRRINSEFEAYKMQLLIEMCQLKASNLSTDAVRLWHEHRVDDIMKLLFGRTYWSMWTPQILQTGYRMSLENFFGHILQAMDQLAFLKKNSYIVGVTGMYAEVFRYYMLSDNK